MIENVTGRIARDLEYLKQFTATPGDGCTRLPFTKEARNAVDFLKELMVEAGLSVREDEAGNVIGTLEGENPFFLRLHFMHYDGITFRFCYQRWRL